MIGEPSPPRGSDRSENHEQAMTSADLQRSGESLRGDLAPQPMRHYMLALGLYGLWCLLAWISDYIGQSTITPEIALLLIAGVSATNALFFGVAHAGVFLPGSDSTITTAQCAFGIVWTTVYAFFSSGGGELVLGMYVTTILFGIFHVGHSTFSGLVAFAAVSYAAVTFGKGLLVAGAETFWHDLLSMLTFFGVMGWVLFYGRHIRTLRERLHDRNEELQVMIRKVTRVAERDHLTKSFNRHYIMDSLAREKGRADRSNIPFAVCIFDLDHFKAMNDEHGHLVGDRILRSFAKRVRAELRTMDAVNRSEHRRSFGRFGGEEFIAILPTTNLQGAQRCAERIRQAIDKQPFDDVYHVTVSAGVAEYKRGETVPELLERADDALYEAKAGGRNRVCLSVTRQLPAGNKAKVMDLRSART